MSRLSPHLRGILYALAGYTIWVLGDTTIKIAGTLAIPKFEILLFSSISGMIVILAATLVRGEIGKLRPRRYGVLILAGLMFTLSYLLSVWVLPRTPLAIYYVIIFACPLMLVLMASRFLKEHLDWKHLTAITIGFAGVIVAIDPLRFLSDGEHYLAYAATFIIMIIFATQMLMLRMMGHTESRESLVFYMRLTGFFVTLIIGYFSGFGSPSPGDIAISLISGIFGGLGWLCMAEAYKCVSTVTVASLHYSQIIAGALFGYLIWGEVPTLHLAIGVVVIIATGLYVAVHARKTATKEALAESVES
jgi:drug/metabolite transporter (DMT)-like permease